MADLGNIRREYLQSGLRRKDLPDDPMQLFELWMQQACAAELMDLVPCVLLPLMKRVNLTSELCY